MRRLSVLNLICWTLLALGTLQNINVDHDLSNIVDQKTGVEAAAAEQVTSTSTDESRRLFQDI